MRVTHGLCVLAAVIVADHFADRHRAALRALLYHGQLRVHWRDESAGRRAELIDAMYALANTGAIVIATGTQPRRQERARRTSNACSLNWPADDTYWKGLAAACTVERISLG